MAYMHAPIHSVWHSYSPLPTNSRAAESGGVDINSLKMLISFADVEKFLSSDDNASKVAAAGVILAALLALVAGIVLVFSACGKGSGGPKIGGSLLIFAGISALFD